VCAAWVLAAACGESPPDPIPVDAAQQAAAVQAFADARASELSAPDSWLSLIGLHWLAAPVVTMGSAADNDIVLPKAAPAHLGRFISDDQSVTFRAAPGMTVVQGVDSTLDLPAGTGALSRDTTGDPEVAGALMTQDVGSGKFVVLRHGPINWIIIRRGKRWAVRLRDNAAERYEQFHGIDRYPTDEKWRVTARWMPHEKTVAVPNFIGTVSEVESPAELHFWLDGREMSLDVPGRPDHGRYMLVFADSTSGRQTYGGGRFLWIDGPADPERKGRVVVDFNMAYNPPCVWSEFATCPLPTKDNRLPIRVEAGEKNWAH